MQPARWLVLHPREHEPLAPITLHQALVIFRVDVERSTVSKFSAFSHVGSGIIFRGHGRATEHTEAQSHGRENCGACCGTRKLMARRSVLHRQP